MGLRNLIVLGAVASVALGVGVLLGGGAAPKGATTVATPPPVAFAPQPDSAIGDDELGREIARGRRIFTDTAREVPHLVGNDLKCSNCHLDAGRRAGAAPMWAAYGLYPAYRKKNGHVNTFDERIRECFRYSMNGVQPPAGDPAVVAVEAYAAFLAKGAPMGVKLPGQGYKQLDPPAQPASYERGRDLYGSKCAACHGAEGQGQKSDGEVIVPPVWGPRSYNWGAGMAQVPNAAAFIKANMPQDNPGSLTEQEAWDLAAYIDGKSRPQDPRYAGSLAETASRFHDPKRSLYGTVVDGVRLGGDGPPKRRSSPQ